MNPGSDRRTAPILVCFAVPEEARPFRRLAPDHVEVLVSGIGRANAAAAVGPRLESNTPRLVLTCGFAGGLDPRLPCGTVVFDADPHPRLAQLLAASGAVQARVHSADRVAVTVDDKRCLREASGADAVEMESAVIRDLCRQRGIPSATVRAISDRADEALPLDFNALFDDHLRLSPARLAVGLLRKPGAIPGLLRLQRHCTLAARNLARVLQNVMSGYRIAPIPG